MNPGEEIARWVKTHPLFLIRFDESLSEALRESRQGFEHLLSGIGYARGNPFRLYWNT